MNTIYNITVFWFIYDIIMLRINLNLYVLVSVYPYNRITVYCMEVSNSML